MKLRVSGVYNIPRYGRCIVASNHVSILDPIIIAVVAKRKLDFLAKKELFRSKIFGKILELLNVCPLDRKGITAQTIKEIVNRLKKGHAVVIFPEGERGDGVDLGDFKQGIGFLTSKTSSPIVPAFIKGSEQALAKGARFLKPSPIEISFGKPFYTSELERAVYPKKEKYQKISEILSEKIQELK